MISESHKHESIPHKTINHNGHTLYYYVNGNQEDQAIVFLHPAFADHRAFDSQVKVFSKNYRVIAIDLLGHGLSQPGKSSDKLDATIDHLQLIFKQEGIHSAHFVGVSMGSLLAQYFALIYPEKILSMTILGGYDINSDNKEVKKAQLREMVKWIIKAVFSMKAFRKYLSQVTVIKSASRQQVYEMAGHFQRSSFRFMGGLSHVLKERPYQPKPYPMLILVGEHDLALAQKMSELLHETEKGSFFHIISEAGHCANMDNPIEFNRILLDFLQRMNN